MTAKESTALANRPASPGTGLLPADLAKLSQQDLGKGLEGMSQKDRVTPFLGIIQGLSPQINENKPQYIEGASIGDIFNNVTGEVYKTKEGGLRAVLVLFQKVYNAWVPRDLGGGFLGSYADPEMSIPIFVPPSTAEYDGAVQVVETANHFVLAQSADGTWAPAVLSMKSTQLKNSRHWNTLVTMATSKFGLPAWGKIYALTTVEQTNQQGSFYVYKIEAEGFVTDETIGGSVGLYELAKSFYNDIQAGIVKIDPTKVEQPEPTPAETAEEPNKY